VRELDEENRRVRPSQYRQPIGVAEWNTTLVASVPRPLRGKLPTVEQLEAELGGEP
jgi:hypothetical protein